jgi:predicted 2-oxoglutarate/Fe(II)-dependent dioxygenase YbiX
MYAALLDLTHPLFWTVDGVLSPAECDALIARIEAAGPELAPVHRAGGPVIDLGTRNNSRVMFDDPALSASLFERVRARVPAELMGMRVVGANERLRCYRYDVGQRFAPHYDGSFVRDGDERSLLTLLVYLNEGFGGGETRLLELDRAIAPRAGRALLFQHAILHEGAAVTAGVKYAIRSDVMYRRAGRDREAPTWRPRPLAGRP